MYIKRIYLKNIRCFKELDVSFSCPKENRNFSLFLGPSGVGKTTILRSIAIGLTDDTSASGLLSELTGEYVRHGAKKGTISIELQDITTDKSFKITTTISENANNPSTEPEISKEYEPNDFPWEKLFLCGYGAARRAFGSESYSKYRTIDSVYTLFSYDTALQNLELPFFRLSYGKVKPESLLRRIERVMELSEHSIKLDRSGFSIKGHWGKYVPVGALGDGYAATFAWIADMIGWAMLFQEDSFDMNLPGIVLLDEIEHHLHPSWQRRIVKSLHEQFPSIQFIATSHAPMCAIGATELEDNECDLVSLRITGDHVEGVTGIKPPRGLRADQVLTSPLFGLSTSSDNQTKTEIERYSILAGKKRTKEENSEFSKLKILLDEKLGSGETKLERMVAKAVSEVLSKEKTDFSPEAIDYETKRQIKELLGDL